MTSVKGTVRKLGLEGGLWALVTDEGQSIELLDAPDELKKDGQKAEVTGDKPGADVTIGMVGDSMRVESYRLLD